MLFFCYSDLPLLPPTDTLESKKRKNVTLECKENSQTLNISDHKTVNKSKNRLTPLKLYSKKHDKKGMALREGSGWVDPIGRPGRATSRLLLDYGWSF